MWQPKNASLLIIWLWSIHSPWLVNPRFFALLSLLINKIDPLNIRFQTHKLNNPIHRNSHTLSHLRDIFISITLICSFLRMAQNIVFFLSRSVWDRTRLARYLEDHLKPSCVSFSSPNSSDWLGKRSPDPCVHHHMCKDGKTFLSTYESLQKKIYRIHFENYSFDLIYQGTFGFSTAIAAVSFRFFGWSLCRNQGFPTSTVILVNSRSFSILITLYVNELIPSVAIVSLVWAIRSNLRQKMT